MAIAASEGTRGGKWDGLEEGEGGVRRKRHAEEKRRKEKKKSHSMPRRTAVTAAAPSDIADRL